MLSGTYPNPRTTYLVVTQHAWKSKDFTHFNLNLHCGFVKLHWLYLLKHFKKFGPNLNLLLNIKIIHHKLGWIDAYSSIFISIAIRDWFPWKEATCNRHNCHGSNCNPWTITSHITPCVVSPLLGGPSTTQSIALNQILTKSFDMIFQESTMRPKKKLLYLFGNKAKFKGIFLKLIKILLQMPLVLKH